MSDGRRFTLLRGNDLLSLEVELIDLAVEPGSGGSLVLAPTSGQARLIVHFPPQHLLEQAFGELDSRPFVQARMAGSSRLVFRVQQRMPLTLDTLLGWDRGRLAAVVPSPATPLSDRETALELPFRLLLAPDGDATWKHRVVSPVPGSGSERWYELWHTQIEAPGPNARVWIVAALQPGVADTIGKVSVNAGDRPELAKQSRRVTGASGGEPDIRVNRLLLSSLGASVDLTGAWNAATDLRPAWRHVTSFGRDQYVRVTTRGFLRPFGHRASLTTVTERAFGANGDAHLSQYHIVTVNEREKSYDGLPNDALREMPLRRVRIETTTTPRVSVASSAGGPILQAGVPYPFQLTGFDWDNRPVSFTLPLSFVPEGASSDNAEDRPTRPFSDADPFSRAVLPGQTLAFAPGGAAAQAATRLAAQSIDFATKAFTGDGIASPTFVPVMKGAQVSIPAVDQIFGSQKSVEVSLAKPYLESAFGQNNPAQIFLEMVETGASLPAKAQQMGGMIAPSLNFVGVSRELGAVSGMGPTAAAALSKLYDGKFSPESFLGAGTKLFGSVLLTALLPETSFKPGSAGADDQINVDQLLKQIEGIADAAAAAEHVRGVLEAGAKSIKVPAMSTRSILDANGLPQGMEITYLWKPEVRKDLDKLIKTSDQTKLWLLVRMTARAGVAPEFRVEGHFTDFSLPMLKMMTVAFKRVRFRSAPGRALELKPEIGDVTFDGPLKFINSLQEILSAFGVDSPFDVKVQPTYLTATYSLGIPPFSLGVFGVENLRLFAGLKLPFVESAGPISIRFGLSERAAPFLVSYSLLAGGGFFSLELDAGGGVGIEAAIEIGGKFAFDVGVAKGGVYAMAGIYFSVKRSGSTSEAHIQGYIRAGGFVDILGIAGVTIEFFVGLDYDLVENLLHGFAKVKACIEVLFFNECVGFDVSYTIPGPGSNSASRPQDAPFSLASDDSDRSGQKAFTDLITRSDWDAYCAAFA